MDAVEKETYRRFLVNRDAVTDGYAMADGMEIDDSYSTYLQELLVATLQNIFGELRQMREARIVKEQS